MDVTLNYKQFIREANLFNKQLARDRRQRLPFIDAHTGVAQSDCSLWHEERDRNLARGAHLYSYPAHRWQKRRREYLMKWAPVEQDYLNELKIEEPIECANQSDNQHLLVTSTPSCSSNNSSCQLISHLIGDTNLPFNVSSQSLLSGTSCGGTGTSAGVGVGALKKQKLIGINQVGTGYHYNQHQPPSRADSTGSHSFVDSDSRDHSSSAASQSLAGDSPHSNQQLDDEPANHLCISQLRLESNARLEQDVKGVLEDEVDELLNYTSETSQSISLGGKRDINLKVAIESCPTRNINKCKSILVKNNGYKTTYDNNKLERVEIKIAEPVECNNLNEHQLGSSSSKRKFEKAATITTTTTTTTTNCKPHVCPICDQTYKTRPGLSYHYIHVHDTILPKHNGRPLVDKRHSRKPSENVDKEASNQSELESESTNRSQTVSGEKAPTTRLLRNNRGIHVNSLQISTSDHHIKPSISNNNNNNNKQHTILLGDTINCESPDSTESDNTIKSDDTIIVNEPDASVEDQYFNPVKTDIKLVEENQTVEVDPDDCEQNNAIKNNISIINETRQNLFCDFCLGTTGKNRRTRQPEELISCSNCGSSGHPSCLQFSDNIRQSIQRYNWQCIDCKTCSTCGKADHEDQLLFCDDCDRSYHTFCLCPPLDNLPEGNWTCKLCLSYFYNK